MRSSRAVQMDPEWPCCCRPETLHPGEGQAVNDGAIEAELGAEILEMNRAEDLAR